MTDHSGLGAHSFDTAYPSRRQAVDTDIDELGHVNNAAYVKWIQDAAVGHWTHLASGPLATDHVWVCLRHEIDYLLPILPGETAHIRTWLGKRQGARFDRHIDIRKEGSTRASVIAVTTWVMLDKATGRPRRVGDDVMAVFGLTPSDHS